MPKEGPDLEYYYKLKGPKRGCQIALALFVPRNRSTMNPHLTSTGCAGYSLQPQNTGLGFYMTKL